MAAPTYLVPAGKFLVVTAEVSSYTGVTSNTPSLLQGYVESIGIAVTKVGVGQYIMFEKQFAFTEGATSWLLIHEDNINSVITPLAP